MSEQYQTTIGLEVHVELATKTKIFCGCSTEFGGAPNTHTCPICTGMPGTLPILNKQVVEYALAAGMALNCKVNRYCRFDRKNYFYPDNPQNYQISQLYLPICYDGYVEIENSQTKRIRIHEIHMEEDAGKLIHDDAEKMTLIDYNRSGVPLIEIVSEPDMDNADEVIAYLEKLRLILQYLGVSDCKLQEGSMRADVNLSVREIKAERLGTRTEMKNLNSFRAIRHAIEGERKRQIALLEQQKPIIMETRRWDDDQNCSYTMRSKEDARDYRYFPEPDLPPLVIDEEWIAKIKARQPEMRDEKRIRYKAEYDIPDYDIDILTGNRRLANLFEETAAICHNPKKVSNWLMGETLRLMKERDEEPEQLRFSPKHLAELIDMTEQGMVSTTVAKEIFEVMYADDIAPETYAVKHGMMKVSDPLALKPVIERVLVDNPQSVIDYRNGKERAIGFLVGQTMKAMQGKADPGVVSTLLKELL